MLLMTHPAAIWLRNVLRRAGATKWLGYFRSTQGYEQAVEATLLQALRPGDVVWDVGANIGHYTLKMAERVGADGKVFAFEPSPVNLERLKASCTGLATVAVRPLGLSSVPGRVKLSQGADLLGATSRLARSEDDGFEEAQDVEFCRGDDLIASGMAGIPNVMKIDVEGHELEVLEGMPVGLKDRRLRALVVEVHFGLLASAGRFNAPRKIENCLAAAGFTIRWIDASHLHAVRQGAADR